MMITAMINPPFPMWIELHGCQPSTPGSRQPKYSFACKPVSFIFADSDTGCFGYACWDARLGGRFYQYVDEQIRQDESEGAVSRTVVAADEDEARRDSIRQEVIRRWLG